LSRGWTVNTPLESKQRGGSVMIGVEDARAVVDQLAERRVFVDWRPGAGLRISPHFFNTDEEIDEAMNVLASLIEK
jgi:kynureninase